MKTKSKCACGGCLWLSCVLSSCTLRTYAYMYYYLLMSETGTTPAAGTIAMMTLLCRKDDVRIFLLGNNTCLATALLYSKICTMILHSSREPPARIQRQTIDLHETTRSTRKSLADALDLRFFKPRYGPPSWVTGFNAYPEDACSYSFDIALFLHPVFSSLRYVQVMVRLFGGGEGRQVSLFSCLEDFLCLCVYMLYVAAHHHIGMHMHACWAGDVYPRSHIIIIVCIA